MFKGPLPNNATAFNLRITATAEFTKENNSASEVPSAPSASPTNVKPLQPHKAMQPLIRGRKGLFVSPEISENSEPDVRATLSRQTISHLPNTTAKQEEVLAKAPFGGAAALGDAVKAAPLAKAAGGLEALSPSPHILLTSEQLSRSAARREEKRRRKAAGLV
jgi:hypothetical protein